MSGITGWQKPNAFWMLAKNCLLPFKLNRMLTSWKKRPRNGLSAEAYTDNLQQKLKRFAWRVDALL